MQLTPLSIQLLEYSNKDLMFGTIITDWETYGRYIKQKSYDISHMILWNNMIKEYDEDIEVIGNPYWRGRICMLSVSWQNILWYARLSNHFHKNPELYDMDCLSRPEETQLLVLSFLQSLWIK